MKKIIASIFVFGSIFVYTQPALAATSTNLIINASVETAALADPNMPIAWNVGSWGTNNAAFAYPVAGYNSSKAVEVSFTSYADGDAKWYADEIAVVSGTIYTFSDVYRANATTSVVIRYTSAAGVVSYRDLVTEVAPSSGWKTLSLNFTVPAGTKSISVWHLLNRVGTLTTDLYSLSDASGTPPDTTLPVVVVTSPTNGASISATVAITANATDNVSVGGVRFFVDGMALGSEVISPPYTTAWNTTLATNGLHTITALARDTSGNTATSAEVSMTVGNSITTATTTNLILNPSLEIFGADSMPVDWSKGNWGTNNALFSYTSTSSDGAASGRIDITSYTDGDAKWYFKDVAVIAGEQYSFSDYYESSVATFVTLRYTLTNGTFLYVELPNAAQTPQWKKYSATFVVPASVVSATIFHRIASMGFVGVDSYSLVSGNGTVGNQDFFAKGMVTLTFDDGWLSQYTAALPILNSAGLKGVFAIISDEAIGAVPENRIANPSLESISGGLPVGWNFEVTGTNNAVATYSVLGQEGASAARVTISNYKSGDAKWYFDDTSVIPDQDYTYTEYYNSNASTTMTLVVYLDNGSTVKTDLDILSASSTWAKYIRVFHVPKNTASLTILHRLRSIGTLTIDNTDLNRVQVYVNPTMVREVEANGHEIASHSQTHPSLTTIPNALMLTEVNNSKRDLLSSVGVNSVQTFVYPYGDHNAGVELAVKNAGYIGARSDIRGYNIKTTDRYALKIQQVGVTDSAAQIQAYINTAIADKTWLILMYHAVDYLGDEFSTTPEVLQANVNYLKAQNVPVVTLSQGLGMMNP